MKKTESTDLSTEVINGISLGTDLFEESFANKHVIEQVNNNEGEIATDAYYLDKSIYVVHNDEHEILFIRTSSQECVTNKGIKVGDSIENVKEAYGRNYYKYTDQGVDIIGYVDHENNLRIEFWHFEGEINSIDLSHKNFVL